MLIFFLGSIVFLNFIIAEIGSIYSEVNARLDNAQYLERASMVKEVEDAESAEVRAADKTRYPKYIVIRQKEEGTVENNGEPTEEN